MLYLLGIRVFQLLVIFSSLFDHKAKLWLKGRKNIFKKLEKSIHENDKIIWVHCASLGEFEQGRPMIEAFKEKYPSYKILLTFYSPSGYEIRKNYEHADFVYYLPLDTPKNAKKFIKIVKPKIVLFIKYEFWFFFLREINRNDIPLYLVSGIFRSNQRFFKRHAEKSRKMLKLFTHFFVQNVESEKLLKSINIKNVSITGDTRFDRVFSITQNAKELPLVEKFAENQKVLIGGSTWKPDEELLIRYFNETSGSFKLIIAPHEIHKENIDRISFALKDKNVLKYSEANPQNIQQADVLLIDGVGFLSSVYRYGSIAYIGGGFGKGIHNILEAATFGLPIIFGPNYLKFNEAVELESLGGAFSISNYNELKEILSNWIDNEHDLNECKKVNLDYIRKNIGATNEILEIINF
ncbi:MAG: 3-deoxy-D-manno-octulosonic acid transferase [Marinilabiliales bacterium]|nr:MAG: 3-deoxy-D-manno-octulosonic acid transferase [Marinilabiliales bacterium]